MADNDVVTAGGRLTDWVSLGVLATFVPRDAVDDPVAAAGKLPPHVMVYFVMALALFADEDYEEVAARLTDTLTAWGCWDDSWSVPTSGGITQARQRLGYEPVKELFAQVAVPVAEELTAGAYLGPWRLMVIGGFEWDAPDTPENAAAFGSAGAAADDAERPAFPKVRVVTVSECASHAVADAAMGGVAGNGVTGERWFLAPIAPGYSHTTRCQQYPHRGHDRASAATPIIQICVPRRLYRHALVGVQIGGSARFAPERDNYIASGEAPRPRDPGARKRRSSMASEGAQGTKNQLRATPVTGTLTAACQLDSSCHSG